MTEGLQQTADTPSRGNTHGTTRSTTRSTTCDTTHDTKHVQPHAAVHTIAAIVASGICSGCIGALMILFLRACVWVFFGVWSDSFMEVLVHTPPTRRILAVIAGALLAACCWSWLRRKETILSVQGLLTAMQSKPVAPHRLIAMSICALVQVMAVGAGNSFGRENAPRQMAAAASSAIVSKLHISREMAGIIVASSAGAALAAVYNTPIAAVPFTACTILHKWNWRVALTSAAISAIATPVSWLVSHNQASTPLSLGSTHVMRTALQSLNPSQLTILCTALLLLVMCCAAAGAIMRSLCASASAYAKAHFSVVPTRNARLIMIASMAGAGTLTGCVGLVIPQLLGNGKNSLDIYYGNAPTIAGVTLAIVCGVIVMKPVLTAFSLQSGMVGGLLMPSASLGASIGVAFVLAAQILMPRVISEPLLHNNMWPLLPAFALIGAACVLAVTQRSGVFATVFLIELSRVEPWLWLITAVCVAATMLIVHIVGRYGISRYIALWHERQQQETNQSTKSRVFQNQQA